MKSYKMPKLNVYEVEAKYALATDLTSTTDGLIDNGETDIGGGHNAGEGDLIIG